MNQYEVFIVQTFTLPPSMHQKLTEHGRSCMQNNQLLTKSHAESEIHSIVLLIVAFYYFYPMCPCGALNAHGIYDPPKGASFP
jgi:hypothetical protein